MINLTLQNAKGLLKFRLSIYFIAYAHLVIMTPILLNKDFEQSEDERIRIYAKLKWKLITSWFNLISMGYIPLCLYCDWRELKSGKTKRLTRTKKIRDFIFSNLLLPTTLFADILFWRLWCYDKSLLMPHAAESIVSIWEHHSMHTASLLLVVFDLIFVRRKRPNNLLPGIIAMLVFLSMYIAVCVHSLVNEEYIYPVFKNLSPHKLFILAIYTIISFLFYHSSQWFIVELIHGQKSISKKIA